MTLGPPEAKGQKRTALENRQAKVTDRKQVAEIAHSGAGLVSVWISLVWIGRAGNEPRAGGLLSTMAYITSFLSPWSFSIRGKR